MSTRCPPKQYWLLRLLVDFYRKGLDAIKSGVPPANALREMDIAKKLPRLRMEVKNEDYKLLEKYDEELINGIEELKKQSSRAPNSTLRMAIILMNSLSPQTPPINESPPHSDASFRFLLSSASMSLTLNGVMGITTSPTLIPHYHAALHPCLTNSSLRPTTSLGTILATATMQAACLALSNRERSI